MLRSLAALLNQLASLFWQAMLDMTLLAHRGNCRLGISKVADRHT